jgi:hypothetical protein
MTREDEEDEERPVVSSLELERQWRGSTAAVKSQWWRASAREQERVGESSRVMGRGVVVAGGGAHLL